MSKLSWHERTCEQCGKTFYVRNCYAKRGGGKFCSTSCATTYRNLTHNPSKIPEVRAKISKHHADVSGANNPMYGRTGEKAPGYIDGRNSYIGEIYRRILLASRITPKCVICGETNLSKLDVHHKDGNHSNNSIDNLLFLCKKCHLNIAHEYERDALGRFTKSNLNEEWR